MPFETSVLKLLEQAEREGRSTLLEPELYSLLREGGLDTPAFFALERTGDLKAQVQSIPGSRAVVKVVSPAITHKTEMGGVAIVDNTPEAIVQGASDIFASVLEKGG